MTARTLLRGGCVLTLGARTPNHVEGDVLIEDGRIAGVGPNLRARDAQVVDVTDTIVMPGFVDTHRHAWKSLFRGIGDDVADEPSIEHHRADDVYAATLVGLLGAVEAGITTVVDWADIPAEGGFVEAILDAHADAGLRTVLVLGGAFDTVPAKAGSTSFAFGAKDIAADTVSAARDEWPLARERGLRIHAHAGVSASHRGAVAELAALGLLGDDVTLVHCTQLDGRDLDAVADSAARVSLTPTTEMTRSAKPPPLQSLIDRGIRPGLGVDDELMSPGDIFAQMRAVNALQHATMFDLKLAGKAGLPTLLTTRDVIRYATFDGARTAGVGDVAGSLEPGKQADIVVLRTDRPNIFPINDPIGAVVWGMDTSNVEWVFAGGRPLLQEGRLVADVERIRSLANAARDRVVTSLTGTSAGQTA